MVTQISALRVKNNYRYDDYYDINKADPSVFCQINCYINQGWNMCCKYFGCQTPLSPLVCLSFSLNNLACPRRRAYIISHIDACTWVRVTCETKTFSFAIDDEWDHIIYFILLHIIIRWWQARRRYSLRVANYNLNSALFLMQLLCNACFDWLLRDVNSPIDCRKQNYVNILCRHEM